MKKTKVFQLALILLAMTTSIFAQEAPKYDIVTTSKGDLKMTFVGHGTLMFEINGKVIHIDPVSMYGDYSKMPKADLILVSHEHGDHFDKDALAAIRKDGTKFYTIANVAKDVDWAKVIKSGDVISDFSDFTVEIVPAYNIVNKSPSGDAYHPKGNGVGLVFTFGNTKVYVAGDTENTPEMKALQDIDIAFLPMNLPYTMTPEMVADAAKAFQPTVLYPYHYSQTDPNALVDLLKGTHIEVRIRDLR